MKTLNKNFKFGNILDKAITGEYSVEEVLKDLSYINNSYARNIIREINSGNLNNAIALLKSSAEFEIKMNSEKVDKFTGILLSDEDIKRRINRDMWILGLSEEEATKLAIKRAKRLRRKLVIKTTSIENGTFILEM